MFSRRDRRRAPSPTGIAILYWVLGGLALVAFVLSLALPENAVIERLAPGLATELLGILVTLVFVQRFLERQERTRRLRTSVGALRRGARALNEMASVWGSLVKGAARHDPDRRPSSVDDLFAPHWTDSLDDVDVEAMLDEVERGGGAFLDHALEELTDAREALRELVIGYGSSLRTDYVEAIDDLLDDPFLEAFMRLDGGTRDGEGLLRIARGSREAHFQRLLRAVHIHNELAAEAAQVRDRRTAPRTSLVGMELPLDHDLKVLFSPDQQWWEQEPVPGRFRATRR